MASVIYIASLPYSGSTLLTRFFSQGYNIFGLGEVTPIINIYLSGKQKLNLRKCSCGAYAQDCSVWSEIIALWEHKKISNHDDAYQAILECVRQKQGSQAFIVDSSKLSGLSSINSLSAIIDFKVIHVVKDVRAFVYSIIQRKKGQGKQVHLIHILKMFRSWYFNNKRIENQLKELSVKYTQISYKEFCLRTDQTTKILSSFLKVDFVNSEYKTSFSNHHILRGNRMKNIKNEEFNIRYDDKWAQSRWLNIFLYVLPSIRRMNNQLVYGYKSLEK